ncbi:MAG: hypothetical protein WA020_10095 [Candidatus Acidiferrales bacterium]
MLPRITGSRRYFAALEELIRQGDIALILPRTVVDEFARNKARIIEDSRRSLSSTLKRAREAVEKFGDPRKKSTVLSQLNESETAGARSDCENCHAEQKHSSASK